MPSTKNNKNLRGLPTNPEPEGVRCISVPVPDDDQWIGAFYGQLQRLSLQSIWDRDEAHTAQIVARRWLEVYWATLAGNCFDGVCPIPFPFDVDIGFPLVIVRIGDDGHWEELIDGVWTTPTGDYEVPEVPEREESTATERRCLAAANASYVLSQVYEQSTDAFTSDGTQVAVYEAILEALIAGLGAWAIGFAASGIGTAIGLFFVFYELLETVTSDNWTAGFDEELFCILYANAIDTGSVVTFDYAGVIAGINALVYESGLDLEKQLLLQQVLFMLSIIGVDGLNIAGVQTNVSSADCACTGFWCHTFDFQSSPWGWSVASGRGGWLEGTGWRAQQYAGPNELRLTVLRTFTATTITQISVTYETHNGADLSGYRFIDGKSGASLVVHHALNTGQGNFTTTWSGSQSLTEIQIWIDSANYNAVRNILSAMTIRGEGTNPFGLDNCV